MREFNRFVNNTHPLGLLFVLFAAMFLALPIFGVAVVLVVTVLQIVVGMIDASGIAELVPMVFDALDGEVGG